MITGKCRTFASILLGKKEKPVPNYFAYPMLVVSYITSTTDNLGYQTMVDTRVYAPEL